MKLASSFVAAALLAGGSVLAQTGPGSPPPEAVEAAQAPISAEEARAAAAELAKVLEKGYVFPDVAKRYAAALEAKAAAGDYDGVGTAGAFAQRVTADLRAVSPDNHLRLMPRPAAARGPGAGGPPPQRRAGPPPGEAIEEARWLAPGIAYIRFTLFPGAPAVVEAADRFMAEHADAETVIFDIRTHRGGGLAEMDAIFPYLFARPTKLVTMDTRASVERENGSPVDGLPSLKVVPTDEDVVRRDHHVAPHASEKRLFDSRVYVLTSNFTGSAAEHFALALKRTKRATLIGEATGGAGHYGGMRPVGDRFAVFVPVGRTFDPDTGKGWEGDGVPPDIAVPAERALVEALIKAGVEPAQAEKLSAEVHPKGPMKRPRRAG